MVVQLPWMLKRVLHASEQRRWVMGTCDPDGSDTCNPPTVREAKSKWVTASSASPTKALRHFEHLPAPSSTWTKWFGSSSLYGCRDRSTANAASSNNVFGCLGATRNTAAAPAACSCSPGASYAKGLPTTSNCWNRWCAPCVISAGKWVSLLWVSLCVRVRMCVRL